jgi:hypothetical protein
MARRRLSATPDDPILRQARRIVARAAHEIGAPTCHDGGPEPRPAGPSQAITDRRRKIIGLIADLKLSIRAMRDRRDQLRQEVGTVVRTSHAVSAYHRTSLLVKPARPEVRR